MRLQLAEVRFPTECPDCGAWLRGVLIREKSLRADDIVEISGSVISPRTARTWLREAWSGSFRLPGMRHRLVDAREFVFAIEERKQRHSRGQRPLSKSSPAPTLPASCPRCHAALQGFIAPLELLTVTDIVRLLDGKVRRAAIEAWIRGGLLHGFTLKGVRGPLVEAGSFFDDFEVLKRQGKTVQVLRLTAGR